MSSHLLAVIIYNSKKNQINVGQQGYLTDESDSMVVITERRVKKKTTFEKL
jgi:hypothetical protein